MELSYSLFVYGCMCIAFVLSHASLLDRRHDMDKEQTLLCNSDCPFGFLPDVEGKLTCRCFDPCRNILCMQGAVCVAEMPENCQWEQCSPVTKCHAETSVVHTRNKDDYWLEFPVIQHDDPDLWWGMNTGSDVDVCSQSLPMAAVDCKHKRRRWFFNSMTGKCDRFVGCATSGNNFGRKLYCKEQCRYPFMKQRAALRLKTVTKSVKATGIERTDCLLPLNEKAYSCENQTKRWFFNLKTKVCEKFLGCATSGNNFSRKTVCKAKCMGMNKLPFILKGKYTGKHFQESNPR